jgi:hypothetical protein
VESGGDLQRWLRPTAGCGAEEEEEEEDTSIKCLYFIKQ